MKFRTRKLFGGALINYILTKIFCTFYIFIFGSCWSDAFLGESIVNIGWRGLKSDLTSLICAPVVFQSFRCLIEFHIGRRGFKKPSISIVIHQLHIFLLPQQLFWNIGLRSFVTLGKQIATLLVKFELGHLFGGSVSFFQIR